MKKKERIKTRAGHGLQSLPGDKDEWLQSARSLGLQKRCLSDLCQNGPFSASHAPGDSVLTLRPIWPARQGFASALEVLLETGSFFSQDHLEDARSLIRTSSLQFEKLDLLFRLLCPDDSTPPNSSATLAECLGPFSLLIGLHNRILQRTSFLSPSRQSIPPLFGAPKAARFRDLKDDPATALPKLDFAARLKLSSAENEKSYDSIDDEADGDRDEDETENGSDEAEHDSYNDRESNDGGDEDINDLGYHYGTTQKNNLDLVIAAVAPPRRTPTETLVVDFLVTFMASMAVQVQPLNKTPVCVADAFELTFQFGPIPIPEPSQGSKAGNKLNKQPAVFRARIDGGIPFARIQDDSRELLAIFEVKRKERLQDDVEVRSQHIMEHAATIWERHKCHQTNKRAGTRKYYHNLMFSQDGKEIYIDISTYSDDYLDYLFGPGSTAVIPQDIQTAPFLKFQDLGPFYITRKESLQSLSLVVLSLLVWQIKGSEAGRLVTAAL